MVSLGPIYDLLLSVGYADAVKTDISASKKLSSGIFWCIAAVNDETLAHLEEMHVTLSESYLCSII